MRKVFRDETAASAEKTHRCPQYS